MYNKTATALMTLETLWHQADERDRAEQVRAASDAAVWHPQTDALQNFDKEIKQLIREATMLRLDVDVPSRRASPRAGGEVRRTTTSSRT